MAVVEFDYMTTVRGKVGGVVHQRNRSLNILRKYRSTIKKSNSPASLSQRNLMKIMVVLGKGITTFLQKTMNKLPQKMSAYNYFISANLKNAMNLGSTVLGSNYFNVKFSQGNLSKPVNVSFSSDDGVVIVNKSADVVVNDYDKATDLLAIVVVDKALGTSFAAITTAARTAAGSFNVAVPYANQTHAGEVHMLYISADGSDCSENIHKADISSM